MANLTTVVPNALLPSLAPMVAAYMASKGIDTTGMTANQQGQRYIAERLKDDYIAWQRQQASQTAQSNLDAAHATATTAVNTVVQTAVTDASGITG